MRDDDTSERARSPSSLGVKIVVIQEDQDGVLVFSQQHLKYYMKRALKRLLNLKPSTAILGSSHTIVHVILWLTDA